MVLKVQLSISDQRKTTPISQTKNVAFALLLKSWRWYFVLLFLYEKKNISNFPNEFSSLLCSCTNDMWNGCRRQGTPENIINPVRSARVRTLDSFQFKYGRMEVVAKMPTGDWLWPGKNCHWFFCVCAWIWNFVSVTFRVFSFFRFLLLLWTAIWLLPSKNVYGIWPRSGEIDLLESREFFLDVSFKFRAPLYNIPINNLWMHWIFRRQS